MIKIPLLQQPDGISCGNTCLKMVFDYLGIHNNVSIQDIVDICGTNNTHGTRHIEMKKGLEYYNIPNKRNKLDVDDSEYQIKYLDSVLNNGDVFLLRTLTQGIFHWVIVCSKCVNGIYNVNDPWLGYKYYTKEEIVNIWKPRDYDGFEVLLKNK